MKILEEENQKKLKSLGVSSLISRKSEFFFFKLIYVFYSSLLFTHVVLHSLLKMDCLIRSVPQVRLTNLRRNL